MKKPFVSQLPLLLCTLLGVQAWGLSTSTYCNGQALSDASATYYPNGNKATDTAKALTYYPDGSPLKDAQGIIRYPNGQIARDAQLHYPSGQFIRDDQGAVFYPDGKKLKDGPSCFDENGAKLTACPAAREIRVPILLVYEDERAAKDVASLTVSILDLNTIQPRFDYRTEVIQHDKDLTMHYRIDIRSGEVFGIDADCK